MNALFVGYDNVEFVSYATWFGEIGLVIIGKEIRIVANGTMTLKNSEIPVSTTVNSTFPTYLIF